MRERQPSHQASAYANGVVVAISCHLKLLGTDRLVEKLAHDAQRTIAQGDDDVWAGHIELGVQPSSVIRESFADDGCFSWLERDRRQREPDRSGPRIVGVRDALVATDAASIGIEAVRDARLVGPDA